MLLIFAKVTLAWIALSFTLATVWGLIGYKHNLNKEAAQRHRDHIRRSRNVVIFPAA